MKSSQIKFANPALNNIDFEITPNSGYDKLRGIGYIACLIGAFGVYIVIIMLLPNNSGMSGSFITAGMIYVALKLIRLSRKYLHNSTKLIMKDGRAPIVYLRSFRDDGEDDPKRWDEKTSEELITQALKSVGPVLTVKDGHQKHKLLGATRIVMGENWRSEIEKLISISQFVIVEANLSDNLLWELNIVRKITPPERLIISFLSKYEYPMPPNARPVAPGVTTTTFKEWHVKNFDRVFSHIFPSPPPPCNVKELCFYYLDKDWKVNPVQLALNRTPFRWLHWIIFTPFLFSKRYKYYLPFWKIKRALLLILHYHGIISQKKYVDEISAERKKLSEKAAVIEVDNAEAKDALSGSDAGSRQDAPLLLKIDTFKPHRLLKRFALGIGVVILPAIIFLGVMFVLKFNWILSELSISEADDCPTSGKMECAIEKCLMATKVDPTNPQAFACLGNAYLNAKNCTEAIPQYDKALELDSEDPGIYYNRAICYRRHEDYDQVILDTTEAIERDANESKYFELRGKAYFYKENYENAGADLRRAIELDSNNSAALYYLGATQAAVGQLEDAISNVRLAMALDANNPIYFRERGRIYFLMKNYDLAINDFSHAIDLDPKSAKALHIRGLAYCKRESGDKIGDYRLAIKDFDQAVLIDGDFEDAYSSRFYAYRKIDELKKLGN